MVRQNQIDRQPSSKTIRNDPVHLGPGNVLGKSYFAPEKNQEQPTNNNYGPLRRS
jgi:hypothetical protein